jgi:hypothetical protein
MFSIINDAARPIKASFPPIAGTSTWENLPPAGSRGHRMWSWCQYVMLRFAIAVLLLASAARAEDPPLVVRPLVGIGVSASDSGFGLGAQLGVRLSSLLLRGTMDFGPSTGPRGYIAATLRGDWLFPITEATALIAGTGIGNLAYGFVFDDPVAYLTVLAPEIGVLHGKDRCLGRVFAGLTGLVPLGPVAHPRDRAGQAVIPAHVMLTLLLSL